MVNQCPCLAYLINQIYDAGNREFSESAIHHCRIDQTQVFCMRVENETSCILVCPACLTVILGSETKYLCTSEAEGDL